CTTSSARRAPRSVTLRRADALSPVRPLNGRPSIRARRPRRAELEPRSLEAPQSLASRENGLAPGRRFGRDRRAFLCEFVARKAVHIFAGGRHVVPFGRREHFFFPRHDELVALPRDGAAYLTRVEVECLRAVEVIREISRASREGNIVGRLPDDELI